MVYGVRCTVCLRFPYDDETKQTRRKSFNILFYAFEVEPLANVTQHGTTETLKKPCKM